LPPRNDSKGLFIKGIIILNIFLIPMAFLGLYLAYIGRRGGSLSLLVIGVAIVLVSPLLAYLVSIPIVKRLASGSASAGGRGSGKA